MATPRPRCYVAAMNRSLVIASLVFAVGCTDDPTLTDPLTDPDGKGDGLGVALVETQLASESRQPSLVTQDDAFIYYVLFTEEDEQHEPQTHTLVRVRKSGGDGSEKLATLPLTGVNFAAVGGNDIYLLDHANLYRIAKTGGELATVKAFDSPWALTADATGAYVAHQVVEGERSFQRITKVLAGSAQTLELATATFVTSMATDDSSLYWLDETQPNPAIGCGKNAGAAHRIGKSGGLDVTLQVGINCPLSVVVDGSAAYYTNWSMTTPGYPVVRLPRFGLPQLLGFAGSPEIALEPSHASWIAPSAILQRRAKVFGITREVAPDVEGGLGLVGDATGVYFWRRNDASFAYELYRLSRAQ